MKKALAVLAAAGMTAAMIGSASAADIPMMPTVAAPAPAPVAPPPPAYSFAGPYFGAHGGVTFAWCDDSFFDCGDSARYTNFGLQGGYNVQFGPVVIGTEVRTGLTFNACQGPICGYSDLNLHAGAVLGERTLIYGIAGLGMHWGFGVPYMNLGLGAEFLVTPDIGLFGQVLYSSEPFDLSEPLGLVFQVGLNLH